MSDAGLATIVAVAMLVSLIIYALLGGADYGAGVWYPLALGRRGEAQRRLIDRAIGPVWEANHVWLILVVVLLFTAFPPAFAAVTTTLHLPLSLMLIGIVLRGSAFTFAANGCITRPIAAPPTKTQSSPPEATMTTAWDVAMRAIASQVVAGSVRAATAAAPSAAATGTPGRRLSYVLPDSETARPTVATMMIQDSISSR